MILTDTEILKALEIGKRLTEKDLQATDSNLLPRGWIRIDPFPTEGQFGSCSVDLRLGEEFLIFKHSSVPYIDVRNANSRRFMQRVTGIKKGDPLILQAKEFVLATTAETVALADDIMARLEGRSSLGRLGIIVHATAGVIDPGWEGRIVLELANHNVLPIAIYPDMRICSLTFEQLSGPVKVPYRKKPGKKYAGQKRVVGSLIAYDREMLGVDHNQLSLFGFDDIIDTEHESGDIS